MDTMPVTEQIISRAYAGANLRDFTPVEIDTAAAHLYGRLMLLEYKIDSARSAILHETRIAERYNREPEVGRYTEEILRYEEEQGHINVSYDALDAEYVRRGRWTRAFLVTNVGGHVHRSMSCSTCFTTTQYHWVTEFSGKTEAEVIEAAGERACTVCYPDAPVGAKGTRMFTPDEVAKQKAREEREAKRAERDAAKVTLTLWDQVAEKVVDTTGRYSWKREVVLTEVTWKTTRALQNDTGALIRNIHGSWAIVNGFEYRHLTEAQALHNLMEMARALEERGVNFAEFEAKQIKRAEREG